MKTGTMVSCVVLAAGLCFGASTFAQPDGKKTTTTTTTTTSTQPEHKKHDGMKDDKKSEMKGVKVGDMAPMFALMDTDGKTVKLEDFKGKVVVLEWFNAECPFSGIKHHQKNHTFNELHEQYNSKNVAFLAVCSSAKDMQGYGKDFNAKKKTEMKVPYPILLDESGDTGRAYGATNTPHCYVIGADGKIAYMGAIDNNTDMNKAGDKNYVKMALDNVLAGKAADPSSTKAYGCGVKYSGK